MAKEQRKYEKEYKVQAVKLAREIGPGKTAKDLMLQTFEPICCYVFHNNFPERLFLCEIRHNDSQNAENVMIFLPVISLKARLLILG